MNRILNFENVLVHSLCGSVVLAVVNAVAVEVVMVAAVVEAVVDSSQIGTLHFSHLIHLVVV